MKKLVIACLLCILTNGLRAQTVAGKVYRASGDTVVANAVVYYSGSMNGGTMTDKAGSFELIAKQQPIPIIVSCVGYYSATVNYQVDQPLIVRLKPKLEALRTVTIRPDGMKRWEEIAIFTREFLGMSGYGLSCDIKNIDDVNFFYDKAAKTLTANADKPIIIVNKKLGYIITYYLDRFEMKPKLISYAGNYTFKEDVKPTDKTWAKIKTNREDVYDGSRMQFVRALWRHSINKTAFRIYDRFFEPLEEDSILVRDSLQQKYVHLKDKMFVINKNNHTNTNPVIQKEHFTFIDQDGYYGTGLLWSGLLGIQRVGDLLPFEYQSEQEMKQMAVPDVPKTKPVLAKPDEVFADNIPTDLKLSTEERHAMIFKNMVLTPANPLNDVLVIKKWQRPVYYKISGNLGSKRDSSIIADNVKRLFAQVSASSDFTMAEAPADSAVNLTIFIGKFPELKNMMSKDAADYFAAGKGRTGYYTWSANGFADMVQFVNVDKTGGHDFTWYQLKAQLMVGLGFFGQIGRDRGSVFYRGDNWGPNNTLRPFDQSMIKALYKPTLKSGMTEPELDVALKNISL